MQNDKVECYPYSQLKAPQMDDVSYHAIEKGFADQDWKTQYDTITRLREINRSYGSIFLQQMLPKLYKNIIQQVDNLRSNNSREALTLVAEIFEHQSLQNIKEQIIRALIAALFVKSVSEKGFLKSEALKSITQMSKKRNPYIMDEVNIHTESNNGTISELAIKTLYDYMENNEIKEVDQEFLRQLSRNINGKRAVVQKKSKEILQGLKKRKGEQELQTEIDASNVLTEEQSNTLRRQLKQSTLAKSKPQPSFKDFMKMKKSQAQNINN